MVTLGASLLLSPLLWDHYLATLRAPGGLPRLARAPGRASSCRCSPGSRRRPSLSSSSCATVAPFWARDRAAEDDPAAAEPSPAPSPA